MTSNDHLKHSQSGFHKHKQQTNNLLNSKKQMFKQTACHKSGKFMQLLVVATDHKDDLKG